MYLINYATVLDWECYREDHGDRIDLEDLASPQGLVIMSLGALPKAMEIALLEMVDEDDFDGDNPRPTFTWLKVAMENVEGDDYQRYDLNADGALYGVMIIRKIEEVK